MLALPEAALALRHADLLRQNAALERTAQLLRQHATKPIHPETKPAEGRSPNKSRATSRSHCNSGPNTSTAVKD